MYYSYLLQSDVDNSLYKDHCQDLEQRLHQHNSGATQSIKHLIPFKIIYFEQFETRAEAIAREKYFKSAAGRRYLKIKTVQQ